MSIPHSLKSQVLNKEEWKCHYCGVLLTPRTATIDHVYPRSRGGETVLDNLVAACQECNLIKADRIIESVANPIARPAATAWIHAYIKSPKTTALMTFLMAVLLAVAASYLYPRIAGQNSAAPANDLDFTRQVRQLDETEANLNALLAFVAAQRTQLAQTQESLTVLREEKTKMEPLLTADRKTVEALFAVQEARAAKAVTRERWIGFALGVIASIVATVVVTIAQYFIRARKAPPEKG